MSIFSEDKSSPEIDADTLAELEMIRGWLETLAENTDDEDVFMFYNSAVVNIDWAMRKIVDRNVGDGVRFKSMLERSGVPPGIVEKVMDRTGEET